MWGLIFTYEASGVWSGWVCGTPRPMEIRFTEPLFVSSGLVPGLYDSYAVAPSAKSLRGKEQLLQKLLQLDASN
jgi:hypothetical protein